MKLRNKNTGEIGIFVSVMTDDISQIILSVIINKVLMRYDYNTLGQLYAEWEDYEPKEPIFDEKIRKGIRAWWDMQDNPFKSAAVMCYGAKDLDGFYHWRIFGYIKDGKQKESTDLCFRTKKLYDYDGTHDYTKEELCGDEE